MNRLFELPPAETTEQQINTALAELLTAVSDPEIKKIQWELTRTGPASAVVRLDVSPPGE